MKKWIFSAGMFASGIVAGLVVQSAHAEPQITQDSHYVYYKYKLNDMLDSREKNLMDGFIDGVREKMASMKIPKGINDQSNKLLDQSSSVLQSDISDAQTLANDYRRDRGATVRDVVPIGFFFTVGVNASVDVGIGAGAGVMFDCAGIPTFVKTIEKQTGKETDTTEWDIDCGGLLQLGIGIGGAGGAAGRGGVGVIFGDIDHASGVVGAGFAEGVSFDASVLMGAGASAITAKNSETGLRNLIIFIQGDVGAKAGIEIHGAGFYLANQEQMAKLFDADKLFQSAPSPSPSPSPTALPTITPITPIAPGASPSPSPSVAAKPPGDLTPPPGTAGASTANGPGAKPVPTVAADPLANPGALMPR
jgi:hypothetical protein